MIFRIGFIGMGKMAQAIWFGLSHAGLAKADKTSFYDISIAQRTYLEQTLSIKFQELSTLVQQSDVILFCVKPQNITALLSDFPKMDLQKKLLISILAGTPIKTFESYLGTDIQVVRVMPNTPALVQAGMSVLAFNAYVTPAYQDFAKQIFKSLGEIEIASESLIDVVTGISGSGPAFLYRIADDIARVGALEGLDYEQSLKCIAQTLVGAGQMLLKSGKPPSELISDVTSPHGTTMAGLAYFDQTRIDTDIQGVVLAAIARAKELGNEK